MEKLGGYTLHEAVGVGSTGTVWRATQDDLGRTVAVKILTDGIDSTLLQREARVLATLDHPNVVAVYDFVDVADSSNGRAWLAEEWVDGERVDELVARLSDHRLTAEQSVGLVRGALLGLAHAHQQGVVHGDVSAGNILIDASGTSKVIDFGLASPAGSTGSSGTPAFVSPEAARGLPVSPASDVYSAAAVLVFLLTGAPPTTGAALEGHGPHMADVVGRALSPEPDARPADAAVFLAELEEAAAERYGIGWLAKAGLAGLTAGPAGAASTTLLSGGGAAAVPAVATVVTSGSADTGRLVPKPRGLNKVLVGGVAGVVVAAAVAVTLVATAGSDDSSVAAADPGPAVTGAPAPSAVTSSSPTPSPTPATVAQRSTALIGTYRFRTVVTSSNNPDEPVGKTYPAVTWRIAEACTGTPCRIAIKSSSGGTFNTSYDGRTIVYRSHTRSGPETCVDTVTGQPTPGSTVVLTTDVVGRIILSAGTPGKASGTVVETTTYSDYVNCNQQAPYRVVRTVEALP